jgi:hypothetical protein
MVGLFDHLIGAGKQPSRHPAVVRQVYALPVQPLPPLKSQVIPYHGRNWSRIFLARVLIKRGPMSASIQKRPNCCAAAK